MAEFVRVRLDATTEVSVTPEYAALHSLKPLNKPAVDGSGQALPAKYNPLKPAASDDAPAKEN